VHSVGLYGRHGETRVLEDRTADAGEVDSGLQEIREIAVADAKVGLVDRVT
jgi:hypothetical protein